MGLIDFILNLAALLLWLNWRSIRFDPLVRSTPATLVGTLRRAEPRRLEGWQLLAGLVVLLVFRAWLYWELGSPADWTPKLNLGLIMPAFRSDIFRRALLYSVLSFLRIVVIFYFWLLVLALLNDSKAELDPIQKILRLHLGRVGRWPWPVQVLLPVLLVTALWLVLHPVMLYLGVVNQSRAQTHLLGQGLLVSAGLVFTLKYLLPPFLFLHLIASYVYLGSNPLWDFVSTTARNALAPLKWLRVSKLDFAPVAGVALIFLLLHWVPNVILGYLAQKNLTLWPQ
jgi:hypothetical protein